MVIEVFKTNVKDNNEAYQLCQLLLQHLPGSRVNIDLHDCDKVLRVEATAIACDLIIGIANLAGIQCSVLE